MEQQQQRYAPACFHKKAIKYLSVTLCLVVSLHVLVAGVPVFALRVTTRVYFDTATQAALQRHSNWETTSSQHLRF